VCQQLSESKELCTRLQDLEKEFSTRLTSMEEGKQQLQEQYADAQAKINSLSQVGVCGSCDVVIFVTDCGDVAEDELTYTFSLYLDSRN